jgi:glycine C-acetyltransferase
MRRGGQAAGRRRLRDRGLFPVVLQGQARIRTRMCAAHTREHLDRAIAAFTKVGRKTGLLES